tara:strand:+ start:239 stop:697 length:459 start_codon:yes stop_codon:yes gene_type:complete
MTSSKSKKFKDTLSSKIKKSKFDTTNPDNTLRIQLESMRAGSTQIVYQLASPSNRQSTAQGGYNDSMFDTMVRNPMYSPLLNFQRYKVLTKKRFNNQYQADILINKNGFSYKFRFQMSLQPRNIIDIHPSLGPFIMKPGHAPVWRTDSVFPL